MKKIIVAIASIISIMCFIASPLFVKPLYSYAAYKSIDECRGNEYNSSTYPYYIYFTAHFADCNNDGVSDDQSDVTYCLFFNSNYDFSSFIDNGGGSYSLNSMYAVAGYAFNSRTNQRLTNPISWNSMTFGADSITFFDSLGNEYNPYYSRLGYRGSYSLHLETNIDSIDFDGLNLFVTVDGAYGFGGVITRKQTNSNGITSTADNLQFHVQNNGADAQWLFAIVPAGQSLDFTSWIWEGRNNIIGSPTYVYACDEWITLGLEGINIFDSSASANAVYCPSVWHASESGSNRTYTVAYEAMNLTANANYQIVVYGCLNDNLEEMSGFYYDNNNLGSTYTVHGMLSEYEEVYRSLTFQITDPAVYNPNYSNPHDQSYPWDSSSDMTELFENGSAYRDEDGNVRIKGFKVGSSTLSWENDQTNSSSGSSSSKNLNVQQSFGGFFNLFNWFLTVIPKDYQLIIFFGVVGIVTIAIIKAVK